MSAFLVAVAAFLIGGTPFVTGATTVSAFSKVEISQTTTAPMTSQPGRSSADCALKCLPPSITYCSAFAFVPEKKICLLSELQNADFASVAPRGLVYRKKRNKKLVKISGQTFQVIQHRSKGELSFARGWTEYEDGFGDETDFWIGLRKIHQLTGSSPKLLRVEAVTWSDELYVCEYSGFTVADASTNYTMTYTSYLSGSSNTTSDSFAANKGMQFSTTDRDNDQGSSFCSAERGNSGWWFNSCSKSNPNGIYHASLVNNNLNYIYWKGATGNSVFTLKSIRLMLQLA